MQLVEGIGAELLEENYSERSHDEADKLTRVKAALTSSSRRKLVCHSHTDSIGHLDPRHPRTVRIQTFGVQNQIRGL